MQQAFEIAELPFPEKEKDFSNFLVAIAWANHDEAKVIA